MKIQFHKVVLLIFILFTSNCEVALPEDSSKETSFELLYPKCTMNSTIRFLPLQENYKFGDNIILNYRNYSRDHISFAPDSEVKVLNFELNDMEWVEMKNKMRYASSPEPYVILGPSDEMSSYHTIVISPDTVGKPLPEIRVVVIGHIYRNNTVTDECTGAFIDIHL